MLRIVMSIATAMMLHTYYTIIPYYLSGNGHVVDEGVPIATVRASGARVNQSGIGACVQTDY